MFYKIEILLGKTKSVLLVTSEVVKNHAKRIFKYFTVYVGGAVFAAALPPRNDAVMNAEQQKELRKLLQSKNPDDLQKANKVGDNYTFIMIRFTFQILNFKAANK